MIEFDRTNLWLSHPLFKRNFQIATPPIRRCSDIIQQVIATHGSGCSFAAYPRFGKTWATEYFRDKLAEQTPKRPIILFIAHSLTKPSARRFYEDLLVQSPLGLLDTRSSDWRRRVVNAWWAYAQEFQSQQLIFIGDEMQKLSAAEYGWIIDVMNDLRALKVQVVAILFGQPELGHLRSLFKQIGRGDILGRFMSRFAAFDGISSAVEMTEVLKFYDDPTESEFPKGSGCCFTEFFLPLAYQSGWRLAHGGKNLWDNFKDAARQNMNHMRDTSRLSIGMEWVTEAVQHLLTTYIDLDRPSLVFSQEHWRDAVYSSTFLNNLGLTYEPS